MKVYKGNLIIAIILFFLMSRVAIDVIWSGAKPIVVVGCFTLFALILSLHLLKKGKANGKLIPLVFFLFPVTLLAGQINSSVEPTDYIQFAMQVFIPCLFLVSAVNAKQIAYQASLIYKKRLAFGVFLTLLLASYFSYLNEALPGQSLYDHYLNAPDHVRAQTLLKSALPLITSGTAWVIAPFILLFILNVRSTILSYLLSLIFAKKHLLFKKKNILKFAILGLPILAILITQVSWSDLYDRLVFKGLNTGNYDATYVATSGRTEIYQMYIQYIADNFGVSEWLFGAGPIWLQQGGPALSAHNDILNLLVSFGLAGLISTLLCYFYFYKSLSRVGRIAFGASFLVLFMTNGVVFHQSNILYVLLFIFKPDTGNLKNESSTTRMLP